MKSAQEKFQELQKKSQQIVQGAIQINTKIESAKQAHEELAKNVKEKYGTSDIVQLKQLLAKWQEENAQQVQKYEERVEALDKEVAEKNRLIDQIKKSAS